MEKENLIQSNNRVKFSVAERSALAAAVIAAIILVGRFHAPVGAVLVGCSLALAFLVAKRWRNNRVYAVRSLRKE